MGHRDVPSALEGVLCELPRGFCSAYRLCITYTLGFFFLPPGWDVLKHHVYEFPCEAGLGRGFVGLVRNELHI